MSYGMLAIDEFLFVSALNGITISKNALDTDEAKKISDLEIKYTNSVVTDNFISLFGDMVSIIDLYKQVVQKDINTVMSAGSTLLNLDKNISNSALTNSFNFVKPNIPN